MELLSKNSGIFNTGIQERKWKIILAGRGFSERMELDLDNIVITRGIGLCISPSRDLHTKQPDSCTHDSSSETMSII